MSGGVHCFADTQMVWYQYFEHIIGLCVTLWESKQYGLCVLQSRIGRNWQRF
jgi:hypothetical protein